jgi:hypothetical protein
MNIPVTKIEGGGVGFLLPAERLLTSQQGIFFV